MIGFREFNFINIWLKRIFDVITSSFLHFNKISSFLLELLTEGDGALHKEWIVPWGNELVLNITQVE